MLMGVYCIQIKRDKKMKLTAKEVKELKEYAKILAKVVADKEYTEDEIDEMGDASANAMTLILKVVENHKRWEEE